MNKLEYYRRMNREPIYLLQGILGVSYEKYVKLEHDLDKMTLEQAKKAAEHFNVDPAVFFA